jgi:hypothetical protein
MDLHPVLTLPPVRIGRALHWGVGGFDVFLAIVLVYGGFRFTLSGEWTSVDLATTGIGSVIIVALLLVFFGTGPQAVRIEADSSGLRLISRTGAVMKEVGWRNPRLSVVLEWTESTPYQTARGLPARWQLKGYQPFSTYLTREAFEEVVRTANGLGLAVTESPCPGRPGWTRTAIRPGPGVTGLRHR